MERGTTMHDVVADRNTAHRRLRAQRAVAWGSAPTIVVSFFALIVLWESVVFLLEIPNYLLPPPSAIFLRFADDLTTGLIIPHFRVTLIEVLVGFSLAATVGIVVGAAVALIPVVERIVYPYILALQTIPKIAVAPLLLIWFGYGIQSKIITAAVIAFFPILVNVIAGLKTVDPQRIMLMRALRANAAQIFIKVRLPGMLPYLFAGLEVAVIFALIGAIVGEFIGASQGLGSLILQRQGAVDVAGVFSVLLYLSIMGLTLNFTLRKIARRYAFWSRLSEATGA